MMCIHLWKSLFIQLLIRLKLFYVTSKFQEPPQWNNNTGMFNVIFGIIKFAAYICSTNISLLAAAEEPDDSCDDSVS